MEVLIVVDVQKEFKKFIQYDLVEELTTYARKFKKVYQIWDAHKNVNAPSYKFPNEVMAVVKLFGKNHFSDKVREYTEEIQKSTEEGTTLKLNDGGYVVRVDNNHDWFYINPEIIQVINDVKNDQVVLVGGADNECLEDIYVAFSAFGVDVRKNQKYIYSAKTSDKQSIKDTFFKVKKYKDMV